MTIKRRTALAAPVPQRTPPTAFCIWRYGRIETVKGDYLFDDESAKSVLATWHDYGNRLTFDYEHKATNSDGRAGDGKSAGSCLLELRKDGLWAVDVRWTHDAATALSQGEWLYFSPAFYEDEKSGRILELINIALTNVPATKRMTPLVAASREGTPMGTEILEAAADESTAKAKDARLKTVKDKLAKAKLEYETLQAEYDTLSGGKAPPDPESSPDVGGDDEDGEDDAPAKEPPVKDAKDPEVCSRIERVAREITGQAGESGVIGALKALAANREESTALAKRVNTLERDLRAERVGKLLAKASREGKLTPRMRPFAEKIGMTDPEELVAYLDALPVVATTPETKRTPDPKVHAETLSKMELDMAERLGVTPEAYTKTKLAHAARRQKLLGTPEGAQEE